MSRTDAVRYRIRGQTWWPLAVSATVAVLVVGVQQGRGGAFPVQLSSILLAGAAGYALDDPAFEVLGASPTSLVRRRLLRLFVVLLPALTVWSALLAWHGTTGAEERLALIAMFAGLMGMGLGAAGVAARTSSRGLGGMAAAPTLFVLLVLSTAVPPRWRPLPLGDIPGGWTAIYVRWTVAAVLGSIVFLVSSRDPAANPRALKRAIVGAPASPRPH